MTSPECGCRRPHTWAVDERQAACCPARIVERAVRMLPRNRVFTRVRWDLADRDLWHPLVVNLIIGACSHPAQDTWTTDELEDAIAARIKYHCIDIHLHLLEQDRAAQQRAADEKRSAPRRRRRA